VAQRNDDQRRPERVVLEGVPYVGYDHFARGGWAETYPFPACVRACLQAMDDEIIRPDSGWAAPPFGYGPAFGYTHAMVTSGLAFQLLWHTGDWDNGNRNVMRTSPDRERPLRRALQCAGYAHSILFQGKRRDEAFFRERIVESIGRRAHPAIAFGVVGPRTRPCVITGYEEGGDVLVGRSFYQDHPDYREGLEIEADGYFRKANWFEALEGVIIIGERMAEPSQRELRRQAVRWGLGILRATEVEDPDGVRLHTGPAAYDAWAKTLEQDDQFPADDMDTLDERHGIHHDAAQAVAEGRTYAGAFLERVAEAEPAMSEDLVAAGQCCGAAHNLMIKMWRFLGGHGRGEAKARKLADPEVRGRIVPLILAARDKDIEMAEHIERALRAAGIPVLSCGT